MKKRRTYEDLKTTVEDEAGYELLTTKEEWLQLTRTEHLKIKCSKNHITNTITEERFKYSGHRCSVCSRNAKKVDYNTIKNFIESIHYQLLWTEEEFNLNYKGAHTNIAIQCNNNHKTNTSSYSNLKHRGSKCRLCSKTEYTYDSIKNIVESKKHKLLTTEEEFNKSYKTIYSEIYVECEQQHKYYKQFTKFHHRNVMCKMCRQSKFKKISSEKARLTNRLRTRRKPDWILRNMSDDPNIEGYKLNPSKYELDHILPVVAFRDYILDNNYTKDKIIIDQFKKIANYRINLQLLPKYQNFNKHDKYNPDHLFEYIIESGII